MMRILIVKTSALGDVVQTFPVVQLLRETYPDAQIDWVVEQPFAGLVEAHPEVNQTIRVNTKKWRRGFWKSDIIKEIRAFRKQLRATTYDMVIDLQSNFKSGLITGSAKSPVKVGFGWDTVHEWPNLLFTNRRFNPPKGKNIREDYLFLAQSATGNPRSDFDGVKLKISAQDQANIHKILQDINLQDDGIKVMVCPGSNWANKQLSKETLLGFLKSLSVEQKAHFVFIWGTLEEKSLNEELAQNFPGEALVVDKMGLAALQNLMAGMDLVISMDSLPLHLAATTSTPTYSVFGASLAAKYKPVGERHEAYQGPCPYGKTFDKRCSILRTCGTGSCIKDIECERLYDHFKSWWTKLK